MGKVYDDHEAIGVVRNIATATRAVASAANIAGAVVAVPASVGQDPTALDSLEYFRVDYNCTLEKATGGGGSVAVAIDGVQDPDTVRAITFAQAPAGSPLGVGGSFYIPRLTATAKSITLQAASSDTNTLTISKITLAVTRVRMPGGLG